MFAPRVRINLNGGGAERVLRPGDTVSGTVEYKSPGMDRVTSLRIDFRGVSKIVPPKGSQTSQEQVELFHISEILFNESHVLKGRKAHFWSFDFVFPEKTGPDRTGKYSDEAIVEEIFEEKPHPMPPSIGSDQAKQASIIYSMYAVAAKASSTFTSFDVLAETPVIHNIENLRCLPEKFDYDWGIVELERKIGFMLSKKKDPQIQHSFTLVATVPSNIVLGQPILITFLVRRNGAAFQTEASPISACSNLVASFTLVSYTHGRFKGVPHDQRLTETKLHKFETNRGIGVLQFDKPSKEHYLSTAAIKDWPPTFKSYSVARSYQLQIDVTVSFEGHKQGQQLHFVHDANAIRLGSETSRLERRASMAPPPPMPFSGADNNEVLPAYQRRATCA